jgi:predicted GIY-YIG superfamily endonuclease
MTSSPHRFRPQVIEIYLPNGDPKSVRRARLSAENVLVYDVPRSDLAWFLGLEEAPRPALYFLVSDNVESTPRCYIGQTDNARRRLGQHEAGKAFWNRALVAVASDGSWSSTHVTYMEQRAIVQARDLKRYQLENSDNGSLRNVPDTIAVTCDQHFDTISVLLATLGQPVLEPIFGPFPPNTGSATPFGYYIQGAASHAHGVFGPEGLVVFKGSRLPLPRYEAGAERGLTLRNRLIAQEVLADDENENRFITDFLFRVPDDSTLLLAGALAPASAMWRDVMGRSYEEVWRAGVDQAMSTRPASEAPCNDDRASDGVQ